MEHIGIDVDKRESQICILTPRLVLRIEAMLYQWCCNASPRQVILKL